MSVKVSLIVAMAENRVIGKDNTLPWRISSDLQYFKEKTMGKPVIMGRKTFDSIGQPLPGRTNIVITRDTSFGPEGVIPAFEPEMALDVGQSLAAAKGLEEVMVIGGAQIYDLVMPQADRLYLTLVKGQVEGDALFPEFEHHEWLEYSREDRLAGEKDSHDYSLLVLDRL
ncbi:dihydrofolate reductase [Emcibacter nanhaiensis]|uniref:Dihydrofolate reductase n=1 Tax=Emcibacter nanhaiensis TaxID=1505037 RepID=A0A501PBX5_9PROT|nr:dihydrofolate reductase [Emcibacter nanhaiensis]TPD57591.1 dihydrofolate reductase [Emcibacter nanhaiensis]